MVVLVILGCLVVIILMCTDPLPDVNPRWPYWVKEKEYQDVMDYLSRPERNKKKHKKHKKRVAGKTIIYPACKEEKQK